MKYTNVVLESFGKYLPDTVVSSDEIEEKLDELYQRLKLPKGRLELMTGIVERRHWDSGMLPSTLSAKAGKQAIKKSGVSAGDIDLLIHASVCRNFLEPATASIVHAELGLSPHCTFFDLSNACLGVLSAVTVASNMIENGQIKRALIVSGENGGPLLEQTISFLLTDPSINRKTIKKYFANLTIGSGAVAFLVTRKDLAPDSPQILGGGSMSKSEASKLCCGDGNPNSLMMETDSEELMHQGLGLAKDTWDKTKKILSWENDTPDWVIGHQVGVAHEKLIMEALGVHENKGHITYPFLGNTGSSALPLTLVDLAESGKIKKGDTVALLGIGSGLSSIMMGVKW
ncbi:MAG: 3-oxoacyl-ACP synthase III [Bacteriovoracaceae bacterium]|nr:3-oxoacyl-ACP synthase III [Bacteriovoracaceae bacterium]